MAGCQGVLTCAPRGRGRGAGLRLRGRGRLAGLGWLLAIVAGAMLRLASLAPSLCAILHRPPAWASGGALRVPGRGRRISGGVRLGARDGAVIGGDGDLRVFLGRRHRTHALRRRPPPAAAVAAAARGGPRRAAALQRRGGGSGAAAGWMDGGCSKPCGSKASTRRLRAARCVLCCGGCLGAGAGRSRGCGWRWPGGAGRG